MSRTRKWASPVAGVKSPVDAPRWSPKSLFLAGEGGLWGGVGPSVLWQDTARTTPVTAVGQPVASWRLYTATGVVHATQGTAGSRPTYQVDTLGRGFLLFDGSDDGLVAPSMNLSAFGHLFVCAGIRKLSDALRGMAIEFGVGITGGMRLEAPHSDATDTHRFTVGGSLGPAVCSIAGNAAPVTSVLTGIGAIATDTAILRRNGAQVASVATDQGTGNFGTANLYFGRRGGTTLPFNGRIYGVIFRASTSALAAASIAQAEAWMNARSGAY